jgi:RimJ/RimL family protein N-acetyltransferase
MKKFSIRQLHEHDWRELSEVRLKALRSDPHVFGSNYAAESQLSEEEWRNKLRSDDSAIFCVFAGETPIGMTGISVLREDETKRTALLWGSWLEPEFRGKGLSELMYKARIDWAKAHPTIERIIVSHRASNVASKHANQKHEFVFTGTHEKIWSDGKTEDDVCYELFIESKS